MNILGVGCRFRLNHLVVNKPRSRVEDVIEQVTHPRDLDQDLPNYK